MHYTPYIPPEDLDDQGRLFVSWVSDEWPHFLVSGLITVITKNPLYGLAFHAGLHSEGISGPWYPDSSGLGAPAGPTPIAPPSTSLQGTRRQGREPSEPGKHGVSRQSSQRRDRARRKECPKGHYWSYKERKCVKSKYK